MEQTSQLTRKSGTLVNTATSPTEDERTAPDGVGKDNGDGTMTLSPIDLSTDTTLGNVEESKVYETEDQTLSAENGLTLSELRGVSYYDERWDLLLDQLDFENPELFVALAASYDQTGAISEISKPATVDYDGPQGIVGSITDSLEYTAYPSEPIVAATFNTDLAYAWGEAVGMEAMSAGVNSWYAPAMNIHRSPFSGRNFEYYSEDPYLSGMMGAYEVSGCSDQGLITTIKHFALNDEECYDNDRSRVAIWCNEQAIREVYVRPFEIAVKNAKMTLKYISDDQRNEGISPCHPGICSGTQCLIDTVGTCIHNHIGNYHSLKSPLVAEKLCIQCVAGTTPGKAPVVHAVHDSGCTTHYFCGCISLII